MNAWERAEDRLEGEGFAEIDRELARWIARIDGREVEGALVALGAAWASRMVRCGHSCFHLGPGGAPVVGEEDERSASDWPESDVWCDALSSSRAVGGAGASGVPLVYEPEGRRLYLARYQALESEVARRLMGRVGAGKILDARARKRLEQAIGEVCGEGRDGRDADQRRAILMALDSRLGLVSGGAGTGKTWTILRIVEAVGLLAGRDGEARVAICAPTGKAAARLSEVLRATKDGVVGVRLHGGGPMTLHRLLGAGHRWGSVRQDAERPLPVDLVVVDEASMVDLEWMTRLLRAVPDGARLVLVGDRHQLPSVEAGSVFADLCEAALDADGALHGCLVELGENFRFAAGSGLGRLSAAIRAGDIGRVWEELDAGAGEVGLGGIPSRRGEWEEWIGEIAGAFGWTRDAGSVTEALAAQNDRVILTPVRRGLLGVEGLNRALWGRLTDAGVARWTPVLVTRNDVGLGLSNGDLGVIDEGTRMASFRRWGGGVREVPIDRVLAWELAYALTVHKAQGSEFREVDIVIPGGGTGELMTRALLYTAVARGRERVRLWGERERIGEIVGHDVQRSSGLSQIIHAGA